MANPQSEHLKSLREEEFILRYLFPLYEKMGFQDIEFYHGGVLEKGGDVVMWAQDHGGERRNYTVVAKRGDLTGAVSGSNSAGRVAFHLAASAVASLATAVANRPFAWIGFVCIRCLALKSKTNSNLMKALSMD